MSSSVEDAVSRVAEITGVATAEAQHLLEACANDVEAAVALFFEQGGATDSAAPSAAAAAVVDDEDNVRAPIAPFMDQMIGPDDDNFYAPAVPQTRRTARAALSSQRVKVCPLRDFAREGALMEEQLAGGSGGSSTYDMPSLDSHVAGGSQRVSRAAAMVFAAQAAEPTVKRSRLGDLFRPPTDISYSGPFAIARKRATELTHWLLVNVQGDNFDSQVLNRDVWANKEVRKLIRRQFMLWQVDADSVEGRRFVAFYHCAKMPYVCVIDPRTGEEVWRSAEPKESTLLGDLQKFLKEHKDFSQEMSDDMPSTSSKRRPVISVEDEDEEVGGAKANGSAVKRSKLMELSEEEQIALAIRNSVRECNGKSRADSSSSSKAPAKASEDNFDFASLDEETSSDFGSVEEFTEGDTKGACELTSYTEKLGAKHDELTTVKLRLVNADGVDEVTQLRWPSDTRLKVLAAYLAECHPHLPKTGYKLICAFPRKTLEPQHDDITLKEFGLHPSANLHLTLDD